LNSGNACYHSVQNFLFSSLLSTNIRNWIQGTIILPVGLCWCESWSLTLREEHRLRVFETGCWGEYLYRREMKWEEVRGNYIKRSFITCILLQV
jgi:hypothetical protein